ncbi:hypothetical protein Anapl_07209 [Anas platyrhynchos]|uniref:Uncharacterized protein n=1 Tax=Anas platyrhynchos TaxID=8839 RepID=R0L7V6_ANAPL|nr:hypothetical protein Anapl_07209 [Anas platyrhynchos]
MGNCVHSCKPCVGAQNVGCETSSAAEQALGHERRDSSQTVSAIENKAESFSKRLEGAENKFAGLQISCAGYVGMFNMLLKENKVLRYKIDKADNKARNGNSKNSSTHLRKPKQGRGSVLIFGGIKVPSLLPVVMKDCNSNLCHWFDAIWKQGVSGICAMRPAGSYLLKRQQAAANPVTPGKVQLLHCCWPGDQRALGLVLHSARCPLNASWHWDPGVTGGTAQSLCASGWGNLTPRNHAHSPNRTKPSPEIFVLETTGGSCSHHRDYVKKVSAASGHDAPELLQQALEAIYT